MKYKLYTYNCLNRLLYVAKLSQFSMCESSYQDFLSPEELDILTKRKHKQEEFIFSRFIIKKVSELDNEQAKLTTIKYCDSLKTAGIFQLGKLKKKLSLSHSGKFVAFSFCTFHEDIGVDIEAITNRNIEPLINEFFCVEDKQTILKANDSTKQFYRYWTEKEAVTKLVNTSILTLLDKSSVELNSNYRIKSIINDDFIASISANNT